MRLWKIAGYQRPAAKKDLDIMRPFLFFKIPEHKVKHRISSCSGVSGDPEAEQDTQNRPYFPSIPGESWCSAGAGGDSQGEKVWAEGDQI